jgi:hypothetical protein
MKWSFSLNREKAQVQSVTEFTCNMEFRDPPKLGKTRLFTPKVGGTADAISALR